jgi:hypothetical protein
MKSSTQVSLVAAAVATALGSAAHALPAADWTNGAITNIYYTGGASAQVQAVFVAVSQLLTSVDVYTDGTGTSLHPQSLSYLVISGSLKAAQGTLPAGTNIGFIYKYNGGSLPNGGLPQVNESNLVYPSTTQLATGQAISPAPATATSLAPSFQYTPGTPATSELPDWGITNEELKLFNFPLNLNGSGIQSLPGSAISKPLFVAPFGVAVTAALYAQKKNWSKAEVAAVLAGAISDWSQLNGDSGSAVSGLGASIIIDNGSGSGTKVAGNQYFLGYPGNSFSLAGAINPNSAPSNTDVTNYTGALNTGATTLQDIKEPSSAAEADDLVAANQAGRGALAILGLEYPPVFEQHSTGINDYYFAAINGTYPDTETSGDNINSASGGSTKYTNVISGTYDFAYQTAFQSHATLTGFEASVLANLSNENISGAHTGTAFPAATEGVLFDPTTTGKHDAGNLSWSRSHNSVAAPEFVAPAAAAEASPL